MSLEIKDDIITKIQVMETRMDALHTLLSDYITDMKGYVAPQSENEMMRVDRNDIWYNLRQIHGAVDIVSYGFGTPFRSDPDYKYAYNGDDSVDKDYIQSEINAESTRRQNNFKKLNAFRTYSMGTGYQPLGDAVDALWKIYNDSIKTFENTDDDYAKLADTYYDEWGNGWEHKQDIGRGLYDIGRGIRDALAGMVDGLISLVAVLLFNDLCQDVFGFEVPDCINERVQGMEEGFALMLKDPQAALEAMGQGLMDTYDEEGICYGIGSAIPDIVIDIVVLKGSGTFMQGTVRAADTMGDAAEAARAARIIEVMTLAPEAAEGFADMAWLMNATEDVTSGARLMNATGNIAGMARTVNRAGGTTTSRETATRITELDELERFYENIFNAQREVNDPYEEFLEELRRLRDDIDGSTGLLDEMIEGGSKSKIGDFTNLEGSTVDEILDRIPDEAILRELYPVEGGATEGFEFKWVQDGKKYRVRVHNADPGAPAGSNAANGWILRIQRGTQYYDYTIDEFQPARFTNPDGPFFDESSVKESRGQP